MFARLSFARFVPPLRIRTQSSAPKQSQNARTIDDLRTPALCCYPAVMEANAKAMLERAARLGCVLRPHVKTAKTLEAAAIQTGGTKRRVVVSTLAEAEFLARGGRGTVEKGPGSCPFRGSPGGHSRSINFLDCRLTIAHWAKREGEPAVAV